MEQRIGVAVLYNTIFKKHLDAPGAFMLFSQNEINARLTALQVAHQLDSVELARELIRSNVIYLIPST
jgi:hypothetical protein